MLLSVNAFNLDPSKILLFGKGLKVYQMSFWYLADDILHPAVDVNENALGKQFPILLVARE